MARLESGFIKRVTLAFICAALVFVALVLSCATSAYAVSESEPNDERTQSTKINVNEEIAGNYSSSWEDDWFKFSLPADGYVSLSFWKSNIDDNESEYGYRIENVDGEELINEGGQAWPEYAPRFAGRSLGLAAGTYYLDLTGTPISGTYTFKVNFTSSSTWEKEPNDKRVNSNIMTLNKTWHGSLFQDNPIYSRGDWYKFIVSKAGNYNLRFKKTDTDDSGEIYGLDVQDVDGNVIYDGYLSGKNKLSSPSFHLSAGTYYFYVEGAYNGEYSFKISYDYSPTAIPITSLKAGKKKATVAWSKSSNASGYQLRYKPKGGSWVLAKNITSNAKTKYTMTGLKKGKTYSFKVRAYKTVNGKKHYSSWSVAKSVKVK